MITKTAENPIRLATEIAQLWPPQGDWTETDYFNLPENNQLVELSEGEVIIMPPPSDLHQKVLGNMYRLFYKFIEEHQAGTLRFSPLAVRLWPGKIREPDLLFVSKEHQNRMGDHVYGIPDLIVEITSPGTRKTDRHEKFYEYAQAGIQEYWIVEPDGQTVEIFVLRQGIYELSGKAGQGEQISSILLKGFRLEVSQIFA